MSSIQIYLVKRPVIQLSHITVSPRPSTWGAIWVFELRGGKFFWGTWGVIWLEGGFQKLRGDFRFWILILKIYILPTDQYFHSIIAKRVTIQYYYTINHRPPTDSQILWWFLYSVGIIIIMFVCVCVCIWKLLWLQFLR